MDDLIARIRAAIDEDERVLDEIERQLADDGENMEGGWSLWGRFGQLADRFIQPKRWRAQVAAHRKILDLHEPFIADEDNPDPICQTCVEGSHLYDVSAYPCPTVKLLAAAYGIDTPADS